jgi:hypothetical protein
LQYLQAWNEWTEGMNMRIMWKNGAAPKGLHSKSPSIHTP